MNTNLKMKIFFCWNFHKKNSQLLYDENLSLTFVPAGPANRRWQCWRRSVSWKTTCRGRHRLSLCSFHSVQQRFSAPVVYFLWLSVSVIPCADTLKWTTVDGGDGSVEMVCVVAFWTAWWPVRDSSATEPRYHTLHAADGSDRLTGLHTPMARGVCLFWHSNQSHCTIAETCWTQLCTCSLFQEFSCWVCRRLCSWLVFLLQRVWKQKKILVRINNEHQCKPLTHCILDTETDKAYCLFN